MAADTRARLLVESDGDATDVGLVADYPMMPALEAAGGPILAGPGLAANMTLAVFGRAEPGGYVDLRALARRFSRAELCDLATSEDGRFTPSPAADALDRIREFRRRAFDLDDMACDKLVALAESADREVARPWRPRQDHCMGDGRTSPALPSLDGPRLPVIARTAAGALAATASQKDGGAMGERGEPRRAVAASAPVRDWWLTAASTVPWIPCLTWAYMKILD